MRPRPARHKLFDPLRLPIVAAPMFLVTGPDLVIAACKAQFRDTHARWGLTSGWGLSVRLPRRIVTAAAQDMMLTGWPIDAAEALTMGLVDRLWPDAALAPR